MPYLPQKNLLKRSPRVFEGQENSSMNQLEKEIKTQEKTKKKPKLQKILVGVNELSLGISIVVAILIGIGLGWIMFQFTRIVWLFWLGVLWGVGGAILNIYKAYKRAKNEFDELAKEPKYTHKGKN